MIASPAQLTSNMAPVLAPSRAGTLLATAYELRLDTGRDAPACTRNTATVSDRSRGRVRIRVTHGIARYVGVCSATL